MRYLLLFLLSSSVVAASAQGKKVEKLIKKGNAALDKNQFVGASVHFTNALALDTTNAQGYYLRGYSFLAMGQQGAAEEDFKRAIRQDEKTMRAYMYLIPLMRDDGRCQEALPYIDKLRNSSPDNVGAAHFQNALCFEKMQLIQKAIGSYQLAADHFSGMGSDFKEVLEECKRNIAALRKL